MPIEIVLFDYSGVLTTPLHMPTDNVPYDPDALFMEMAAALAAPDANPWHELERGEITLAAYGDYAESRVAGASVLFAEGSEHNVMNNLELIDERIGLARELKERGLRVGLVTNNVAEWEPYWLPRLPTDIFEIVIDSAKVGCRKPEAEIYRRAMTDMAITDPSTVLFIDDFEWNVAGACEVGMVGLHCVGDIDLRAEVLALL